SVQLALPWMNTTVPLLPDQAMSSFVGFADATPVMASTAMTSTLTVFPMREIVRVLDRRNHDKSSTQKSRLLVEKTTLAHTSVIVRIASLSTANDLLHRVFARASCRAMRHPRNVIVTSRAAVPGARPRDQGKLTAAFDIG
ncbi:MAG TPA: hypothetical protein VLT45_01015, partial [Kofleriaceae bacterium]|nr:hypothetical protein [Kofleriaceae bacterium]